MPATRMQESEPIDRSCASAKVASTVCMPVMTRNSQSAAMTTVARMLTMPPALPKPNSVEPSGLPRTEPSGASAHRPTGTMTSMVRKGTKTVESMSGTIFLKNFSTCQRTDMHKIMGRTLAE